MNLATFGNLLRENDESRVGFILPEGGLIAPEFHITEVGHVAKRFIDCGGTLRWAESCLLQAWVAADDKTHRLTAGKLARILDLSRQVIPTDDLPVELEHGDGPVSQYAIDGAELREGELRFRLAHKHTDCLAREACGLAPERADSAAGCGCGEGKCC